MLLYHGIIMSQIMKTLWQKYCTNAIVALLFFLLPFFLSGCSPKGKELFTKYGCINCHGFENNENVLGSDLRDLKKRTTREWLKSKIKNPKLYVSDSQMPSFAYLSDRELDALVSYILDNY